MDKGLPKEVSISIDHISAMVENFYSRRWIDFFSYGNWEGKIETGKIQIIPDAQNLGKHWYLDLQKVPLEIFSPYLENKYPLKLSQGEITSKWEISEDSQMITMQANLEVSIKLSPTHPDAKIFHISAQTLCDWINKHTKSFGLSLKIQISKDEFKNDFHQDFKIIMDALWNGILWALVEKNFPRVHNTLENVNKIRPGIIIKKDPQPNPSQPAPKTSNPKENPALSKDTFVHYDELVQDYQKSSFVLWMKVWKDKYHGKKIEKFSGIIHKITYRKIRGNYLLECKKEKDETFWVIINKKEMPSDISAGKSFTFYALKLSDYSRGKKGIEITLEWD
jgi:hypothetical protein